MSFIALVAIVMVTLTVLASIVAARDVRTLKNVLARLEANYKRPCLGWPKQKFNGRRSRAPSVCLENIKKDKIRSHEKLLAELEELKEEVLEEREIKESNPRRSDPFLNHCEAFDCSRTERLKACGDYRLTLAKFYCLW